MSNDEEQMKIQRDKALWFTADIDEARAAIIALASFGHKSLPYLSEIVSKSPNSDIVRVANYYVSQVNKGVK